MITAVDTNILLDVFGADPTFGSRSKEAIRLSMANGKLVACEVVWAEVAGCFPTTHAAEESLNRLGVAFDALLPKTALAAGHAWHAYRKRGGASSRVVPDFLIGAHAMVQAERLLTRDRGFYRTAFTRLTVLDPST